jgi:hypothetical protein
MKSPTLAWPRNSECGGRLAERTASQRFALLYWTGDSKRWLIGDGRPEDQTLSTPTAWHATQNCPRRRGEFLNRFARMRRVS